MSPAEKEFLDRAATSAWKAACAFMAERDRRQALPDPAELASQALSALETMLHRHDCDAPPYRELGADILAEVTQCRAVMTSVRETLKLTNQ